jgi:tyrosyl-tRNA synthetase
VGDPSGKNEERTLNSTEIVEGWVNRIRTQVSSFLILMHQKSRSSGKQLGLDITFKRYRILRDIGKHFSVNQNVVLRSCFGSP